MGLKSRRKGKVGERAAAAYLRGLGWPEARRTQQYNGNDAGKGDVILGEGQADTVHVEVKYGYDRPDLGNWFNQAMADSGEKPCCVVWRLKRAKLWNLTFAHASPLGTFPATVSGDGAITSLLLDLERS